MTGLDDDLLAILSFQPNARRHRPRNMVIRSNGDRIFVRGTASFHLLGYDLRMRRASAR